MQHGDKLLVDMAALVRLFSAKVGDRTTLLELQHMLGASDSWSQAHALFQRIRLKTLAASQQGNHKLECQYCFEEVCAKTLYNLVLCNDAFDIVSTADRLSSQVSSLQPVLPGG